MEEMSDLIKKHISTMFPDVEPEKIHGDAVFTAMGFDSIKSLTLLNKLCQELGMSLLDLDPVEVQKIEKIHQLEEFLLKTAPNFSK